MRFSLVLLVLVCGCQTFDDAQAEAPGASGQGGAGSGGGGGSAGAQAGGAGKASAGSAGAPAGQAGKAGSSAQAGAGQGGAGGSGGAGQAGAQAGAGGAGQAGAQGGAGQGGGGSGGSGPGGAAGVGAAGVGAAGVGAAGASGGSAGTAQGGSAGQSGEGGAAGAQEKCLNGVDDDGDGDVDCADADCIAAMYTCELTAPSGWNGPLDFRRGAPPDASCSAPFATPSLDAIATVEQPPAACTCAYDLASDTTSIVRQQSGGSGCANAIDIASYPPGCTAFGALPSGKYSHFAVHPSAECKLASSDSKLPPTAARRDLACASLAGGGCTPGKMCLPPPQSEPSLCIWQEGEADCPLAYPHRRVSRGKQADTRSCSCDPPPKLTSFPVQAKIELYNNATCDGAPYLTATTFPSDCKGNGALTGDSIKVTLDSQPTCAATQGAHATGCVSLQEPKTVCCAQPARCSSERGPAMVEMIDPKDSSSFCIDETEVTTAQYKAFLADADKPPLSSQCSWKSNNQPTLDQPPGNKPVVWIDWCDAERYCAWAGKRLCGRREKGGGPLTVDQSDDASASEWLAACSSFGAADYSSPTNSPADCPSGIKDVRSSPCCVPSAGLAFDLAGNAAEWTNACEGSDQNALCFIYGGLFAQAGCYNKLGLTQFPRDQRTDALGFRCCADPDEP